MRSLRVTATVSAFLPFAFVAMLILWVIVPAAFGAGGGEWGGQSLSGSFSPSGYDGFPRLYSSNSADGSYSNGSFGIDLDPNTSSLEYANWNFWTSSYDTSRWTATCNLHGLLNSSEDWPQSQGWSQAINKGGMNLSASINFNCYEWPSDQDISSVTAQIQQMQAALLNAPEKDLANIQVQIASLQALLANMQQQERDQTLSISGSFGLSPSILQSSYFRYSEGTDPRYSYPNGYDNPPVITQIPTWTAEYTISGQFMAPTLGEAQAMGAPFAKEVPEPGTWAMLFSGVVGTVFAIRRRLM